MVGEMSVPPPVVIVALVCPAILAPELTTTFPVIWLAGLAFRVNVPPVTAIPPIRLATEPGIVKLTPEVKRPSMRMRPVGRVSPTAAQQ